VAETQSVSVSSVLNSKQWSPGTQDKMLNWQKQLQLWRQMSCVG